MSNQKQQTPPLRLIWGNPITGEYYEYIDTPPITIGRAASLNKVVLNSKGVSRQHARLEIRANQWFIIDQASTNGTVINGQYISQATLNIGDTFIIGPFIFTTATCLD
jgi:pSer/pThr/pTyr-binding forkhead associated (FHA) protein